MGNADLLREVEDSKIPAVLEVLKGDGDWPFSFLMHQIIKMMQDFKKSGYATFKQKLFTVGTNIEGGTFVVLTTVKGPSSSTTYVHVYSSGDEAPDIAKALQEASVPWTSDQVVFDVVYGSVRPYVLQTLKAKEVKYTEVTNSLYWVNPDESAKIEERNPPSDVNVIFLNEGHAKEINEKWSLKFLDSENMLKDCIVTSFGMGVVRKSDRKLLSHAVLNYAGAIIILFTEPEERGKGYASLLLASITRESAKRSRMPVAIINNGNSATDALFKKFNFVPFIPIKYYGVVKSS